MYKSLLTILEEVRKRIEKIEDDRFKHALMYQYLIGGNVSEVAGKYAPLISDMHQIEYEFNDRKIQAVMFIIEVAKRPDYYRACVLPLDPIYDPWVEQVRNWFIKSEKKMPFYLGKKDNILTSSNKSKLMTKSSKYFEELNWLTGAYTTSDYQRDREKVKFTANRLRNLRQSVLEKIYSFTEVDLAYFGAWNIESIHEEINEQVETIMINSPSKSDVLQFKQIGETYFKKLLMRYDHFSLIPRDFSLKDYVEQKDRSRKASRIINQIKQINIESDLKLGSPIFNESLELALDIIDECTNMDSLQSNITEAMKLFEIEYPIIKKNIHEPKNKKSRKLLQTFLDERGVSYPVSMFDTWSFMYLLRTYFDHKSETSKLRAVLEYFKEPLRIPDPHVLWQKILDKFEKSLLDLHQVIIRLEPLTSDAKQNQLVIGDFSIYTSLMVEKMLDKVCKIESDVDEINKQIKEIHKN
jgi:hypothetical protein